VVLNHGTVMNGLDVSSWIVKQRQRGRSSPRRHNWIFSKAMVERYTIAVVRHRFIYNYSKSNSEYHQHIGGSFKFMRARGFLTVKFKTRYRQIASESSPLERWRPKWLQRKAACLTMISFSASRPICRRVELTSHHMVKWTLQRVIHKR
jgi:hypothetical protein